MDVSTVGPVCRRRRRTPRIRPDYGRSPGAFRLSGTDYDRSAVPAGASLLSKSLDRGVGSLPAPHKRILDLARPTVSLLRALQLVSGPHALRIRAMAVGRPR